MRRNYNMNEGGGGGGGGGGSGSNLNMSGGPFLTDIDLELDLLKFKREVIERQQQQHMIQPLIPPLIPPLISPQRNFNQQHFYQFEPEQSGSDRDFSHLYSDGSQQYRKPFGKDWSTQAGHSKQFVGQKIDQRQQRPAQNFVANKVTKATKAQVPPNKLDAQPIADRNKLVTAAIKSVAEVVTRDQEALMLHPDKEPTKQITGRMEMALGAIVRDVRDKCAASSHHELLRSTPMERVIKQTIRERIRSAMLGKVVGPVKAIIKEFRAMYPKDTDIEIVNIALELGGIKPEKNPKPIGTSTLSISVCDKTTGRLDDYDVFQDVSRKNDAKQENKNDKADNSN